MLCAAAAVDGRHKEQRTTHKIHSVIKNNYADDV